MEDNLPANSQNPQTPSEPAEPVKSKINNPFSSIKKIFYIIIAIVCFFGIIQIVSQNLFPDKKTPASRPVNTSAEKSVELSAPASNWLTYSNKVYKYSVDYPKNLKYSENKYSTVFVSENSAEEAEEFPGFYVSVIPFGTDNTREIYNFMSEEAVSKFFSMRDGESMETQSWPYAEYSAFKKLAEIPLFGTNAVVIENSNVLKGEGRVNRRVLVRKNGNTIIIGSFYKNQQELDSFRRFLESFRI